jgi:hypothetical protein
MGIILMVSIVTAEEESLIKGTSKNSWSER